jgi:hypothetical protein
MMKPTLTLLTALLLAPLAASRPTAAGDIIVRSGESIAFVGDSNTQAGWEHPYGYVRLVQQALELQGVKITPIPAGVAGDTSERMHKRIDAVHAAWMSAVSPPETKRRMGFRVRDSRYANGACPKLALTVVYLDLGTAKLTLEYDGAGPAAAGNKQTEGATRRASDIALGNSGKIQARTFAIEDARFGKSVKPDKVDFSLTSDQGVDFVILGVFLQAKEDTEPGLKAPPPKNAANSIAPPGGTKSSPDKAKGRQ